MISKPEMTRPLKKTALGSILFAGAWLAIAASVEAQQPKKVPRIGWLGAARTASSRMEAFRRLIINLKAAKQIGLTISQKVLAQADRGIK